MSEKKSTDIAQKLRAHPYFNKVEEVARKYLRVDKERSLSFETIMEAGFLFIVANSYVEERIRENKWINETMVQGHMMLAGKELAVRVQQFGITAEGVKLFKAQVANLSNRETVEIDIPLTSTKA
jgi:hypothetical protein